MSDNRYRRPASPVGRRYNDARASTGMVYSSSFDPSSSSRGPSSLDPYPQSRHASIYDTKPVKKYSYQDNSYGPTTTATHYSVRPRGEPALIPEGRRPLSMVVRNPSPPRTRPLVSNPSREDPRSPGLVPAIRDDSSRYLLPASGRSRDHHQRQHSVTNSDLDRMAPANRNRPRSDYHQSGGYNAKPPPRVREDDFSYTGPREQFARDMNARPVERRSSLTRRERPMSVYELGGYRDMGNGRRDTGPPPASSRALDRLDKGDLPRSSSRSTYESDPERGANLPNRRHSIRAPVVHQNRDDDYRDFGPRDNPEMRPPPRPRKDRADVDELPIRPRKDRPDEDNVYVRPRTERLDEDTVLARPRKDRTEEERIDRPRKDRPDDDLQPHRPRKERLDDEVSHRPRNDRYDDEEPGPRPRRLRAEDKEYVPKSRHRDDERGPDREYDTPRDRDYTRDRDHDRDRERDRERDRDRERPDDRLRPVEKAYKQPGERREGQSRDPSPLDTGHGKAVAAGLGSLAVAGLAGAAIKSSHKGEDTSDSDSRRERENARYQQRSRDEKLDDRDLPGADRSKDVDVLPSRAEQDRGGSRRDESASESLEDDQEKRRHRQHRRRDRDDADDVVATSRDSGERHDKNTLEVNDESRRRRRRSRVREPETEDLERRTISPGEEGDDRPRRVQLVEPVKDREEAKPRGILKAPRTVPFPEDPNPTREGVAPLKEAGKDGVPVGARWTKISRFLVNPEALEKAHERFEERDDSVIVLRVVSREEIEKLAIKTKEIREARAKEWQEELETQPPPDDGQHRHHEHERDDADEENRPQPMLDQVPANPGVDPRSFANNDHGPYAPSAPPPVPDIKLESVEASNYSTNV